MRAKDETRIYYMQENKSHIYAYFFRDGNDFPVWNRFTLYLMENCQYSLRQKSFPQVTAWFSK